MLSLFVYNRSFSQYWISQFNRISGKVFSENGKPLVGATIRALKAKSIEFSKLDGTFEIYSPYKSDTLVCTYVNCRQKTEIVEGNDTINFILSPIISTSYTLAIKNGINKVKDNKTVEDSIMIKKWQEGEHPNRAVVEKGPKFSSKPQGFQECFEENFKLTGSSLRDASSGVIKLRLLIDKEGIVNDITLIKGINRLYDEAAINAIKRMPNWEPAVQNGRNAISYVEVSLSF